MIAKTYCSCSTTLNHLGKINSIEINDNCYDLIVERFISDSGMEPLYKNDPQVSKNISDSIFKETMSEFLMDNIEPYLISDCIFFNKNRIIDSLLVNKSDQKEIQQLKRQFKIKIKNDKETVNKSSILIFLGILCELETKYKKALRFYDKSIKHQCTKLGRDLKEDVLYTIKILKE